MNEPQDNFSNVPRFRSKYQWKSLSDHPCDKLFLVRLERQLFTFLRGQRQSYNLTNKKEQAMYNLAEDQSIFIIKHAEKSLCALIWDQEDYLAEGYRQPNNHST